MIFANLFFSVWLDTDGGGVTVNLRQAGAHILAVSPELPGNYKGNICVGMQNMIHLLCQTPSDYKGSSKWLQHNCSKGVVLLPDNMINSSIPFMDDISIHFYWYMTNNCIFHIRYDGYL